MADGGDGGSLGDTPGGQTTYGMISPAVPGGIRPQKKPEKVKATRPAKRKAAAKRRGAR